MNSLTSLPLVSRISTRVIRILGCNPGPMTLQGTNTYIVGTGPRRLLIDAGDKNTAPEYTKHLFELLKSENATLEHLVLTHWHHDHIGGVSAVDKIAESKSADIHQSDGPIKSSKKSLRIWKLPRSSDDLKLSEEESLLKWEALEDGKSFEIEGATLRVIWTPGHTTDHACLKLEEENALFSGDCILGEGTAVFEDLHDYMASLSKILNVSPDIIYPGHGPVINEPLSRIKFYIAHRQQREIDILEVLRKHATKNSPLSEIDIVRHVYKAGSLNYLLKLTIGILVERQYSHKFMSILLWVYSICSQNIPETLYIAAAENVNHHLKKLQKENKVCGETGAWLMCV